MALDILHNVIIGQPVRLDACISKGKGCAKRTYNATLCKHSFHRFAYWHKRNGGGGWSEVSFCFVFQYGTALCNRRNEDCNVVLSVGKKQRKKYDSCKRWQCHRRQTKRWLCVVGVWLKPHFFCAVAGWVKLIFLPITLSKW